MQIRLVYHRRYIVSLWLMTFSVVINWSVCDLEFWNISGLAEAAGSVTLILLTCNETIFESVLWSISSGLRWSSHSCQCEKLLTLNLCYLTTEHASDFLSWSQSCLHCLYTWLLLHSFPSTLAPRLVDPFGFLPWLVHSFLAFCLWPFLVNLMCLPTCAENLLCAFSLTLTNMTFAPQKIQKSWLNEWSLKLFLIDADDPLSTCACSNCAWDICSADANQVEAHSLWWLC